MTNLVFLEAATQSESATEIIESNEALINFATAEVDSLVEEQALHTAWHVGAFVEESFDTTYENMTDPISDIVVEATSIFADVIANEQLTESEKMESISSIAHILIMEKFDDIIDVSPISGSKIKDSFNSAKNSFSNNTTFRKFGSGFKKVGDRLQKARRTRIGRLVVNTAVGAATGAAVGATVGGTRSLFAKERKAWKLLVKKEKIARENGSKDSVLKKLHTAKMKAKEKYIKIRNSNVKNGTKVGAANAGLFSLLVS